MFEMILMAASSTARPPRLDTQKTGQAEKCHFCQHRHPGTHRGGSAPGEADAEYLRTKSLINCFFISGEQSLRGEEEDYEVFTVPLCQDCDKLGCDVTFHHKN